MISRYQKILAIAGQPPFSEDEPVFSNVRNLIEIRNHLMHYKREWVVVREPALPGEETMSEKFARDLGKKFATNPFSPRNLPFFPDQCLGHGCAEWAIVNSIIFTDEFFRWLGLPVPGRGREGETGNEVITKYQSRTGQSEIVR